MTGLSVVPEAQEDVAPLMGVERAEHLVARLAEYRQLGERMGIPALYVEMQAGRGWLALGYDSWDELMEARFGGWRLALPRDERREAVAGMAEAGMSTRAIAAAVGVDHSTVVRDIAGGADAPPAVLGRDGKTYTRSTPAPEPVDPAAPEPAADDVDRRPVQVSPPPAPAPPAPIATPTASAQPAAAPHVSNNSGNNEWYTPQPLLDAARQALSGIDLDPASSDAAQRMVQAHDYFTADDDGLTREWKGRVWLNPPYSGDLVGRFVDKLLAELIGGRVSEAVVLVNNATETAWGQKLLGASSAVCLLRGRVRYLTPSGGPANTPLQGQMVVYLASDALAAEYEVEGSHVGDAFRSAFELLGVVL